MRRLPKPLWALRTFRDPLAFSIFLCRARVAVLEWHKVDGSKLNVAEAGFTTRYEGPHACARR